MQLLLKFMALAFLLLFGVSPLRAAEVEPTPTRLEGGTIVAPAQVRKWLDAREPVFILDVRRPSHYEEGHLPGAKHIFITRLDERSAEIPKTGKVVIYSDGPHGWKSYRAAESLIGKGWKNIHWMREGVDGWKAASYPLVK